MSAKHTPGPWHITTTDYSRETRALEGIIPTIQMRGPCHALVSSLGADADEVAANARLIAAAPDLLAALQEVVTISDRKHDAWDRAKSAIKRATEGV